MKKTTNNKNIYSVIEQWEIWWALIALIMCIQPTTASAWCNSDDHVMIVLSQTDGISFHGVKYKVSRESGWAVWNGFSGSTVDKGDELSTNKVDFVQWPWDNCYDIDWKLTVEYNNHTHTEEFTDLEGDHKYAVTVLVGQGGNMDFLPVATSSSKSTAIEKAMENAANYKKWVGDGESETDWYDIDNSTGSYDWIFLQSMDPDDETLSQLFAAGKLSGTIYWNNGSNESWNQTSYESIRPSGIEVRRRADGLSLEDFITQYEDGDDIGPQYYDVIDGFKSKTVNNGTLLSTGANANDGMTVQEFFDFEVKYYYEWTNWLDLDDEGGSNEGDIEYFHELYNKGRIGCQTPTAIQCRQVGSTDTLDGTNNGVWTELEHEGVAVYCDSQLGFACQDYLNPEGCGDWEVRFYCDENESVNDDRPTLNLTESIPETNHALELDGSRDYVNLSSGVTLGNRFTQESWIYPTYSDTSYHGFLGYQPGAVNQRAPGLWCKGKKIHYGFGNGSSWLCTLSGDVLTLNAWNHVAVTFDGTNYKLYINGQQVHNYTGASGKTPYNNPLKWIGRVDNYFKGIIDEVRIWNIARTSSQIQANMYEPLSGNESGLVGYYQFDVASGTTVIDNSTYGYDGTLQGNPQWTIPTTSWY
ncbi:hypothetical protein MHK_006758 [Candidatus Magnetomorum sp. HK-1]|nr:hypothetical protein MHK_006758 [Candidatus Magnetomorum sp. HK-1]